MATPINGDVYYSGINLRDIDKNQMYKQIGFVMQEIILFHTSIRENLCYGKPNATNEEMVDACKKACIYQFIEGLPNGLNTIIGETFRWAKTTSHIGSIIFTGCKHIYFCIPL